MFRVSPPWSARQQLHLSYLSEFTSDLAHLPGPLNVVVNALSRPSSVPSVFPSSTSPVDFSKLSSLQQSCPETIALLSNSSLRVVSVPYGGSSVLCDLSTSLPPPLVPVSLCSQVFNAIHNISHPGIFPTPRLVSCAFLWSGFSKDVSDWARGCLHCNRVRFSNMFTHLFPRFLFLSHSCGPGWASS